jgi:hypothetical protein
MHYSNQTEHNPYSHIKTASQHVIFLAGLNQLLAINMPQSTQLQITQMSNCTHS